VKRGAAPTRGEEGGREGGRGEGAEPVVLRAGLRIESTAPPTRLGSKCADATGKARQTNEGQERGMPVHTRTTTTYLGVVPDEGGAVARVHGTRAEVALDNPHGSPVSMRGVG